MNTKLFLSIFLHLYCTCCRVALVLFLDLNLHFRNQFGNFSWFANVSWTMRDRSTITIAIRLEVWYSPSNSTIVNVVRRDIDLYFQGHEFWNVNISKMVRVNEQMIKYNFHGCSYLPSNGAIANDVVHGLDLNFPGQNFPAAILTDKRWNIVTIHIAIR